jgi:hypothetical protein
MGLTLASSWWPFVCRSVPRISVVNNGSGRGSRTSKAADLEGKMGPVILPYLGYRFKGFERREQKGFEAKEN